MLIPSTTAYPILTYGCILRGHIRILRGVPQFPLAVGVDAGRVLNALLRCGCAVRCACCAVCRACCAGRSVILALLSSSLAVCRFVLSSLCIKCSLFCFIRIGRCNRCAVCSISGTVARTGGTGSGVRCAPSGGVLAGLCRRSTVCRCGCAVRCACCAVCRACCAGRCACCAVCRCGCAVSSVLRIFTRVLLRSLCTGL